MCAECLSSVVRLWLQCGGSHSYVCALCVWDIVYTTENWMAFRQQSTYRIYNNKLLIPITFLCLRDEVWLKFFFLADSAGSGFPFSSSVERSSRTRHEESSQIPSEDELCVPSVKWHIEHVSVYFSNRIRCFFLNQIHHFLFRNSENHSFSIRRCIVNVSARVSNEWMAMSFVRWFK